jgi:uncharacterized caspase-like protein
MGRWCRFYLAATLTIAVIAAAAAQPTEHRSALVIGNSAYPDSSLANPVNDARAIAASLKQLGFEVVEVENGSLKDMERAVVAFGGKLRAGGVGLFFYAGHGLQVKGQNYLVPVDARIDDEGSVRIETVPVDLVTEQMGDAGNRLNMIVLDACRNNPFERRLRGGGRGLAAMDAATGTLVAYATAPGSVAADGSGKNGLYTGELLKALQEPGLKVEDVFKRVRVSVMELSHGAQTPWESSSLTGDFYFRPPAAAAALPAPPPAGQAPSGGFDEREADLAYWKAIKNSDNPEAFRSYLREHPKGLFVVPARLRLAELTSGKQAAPPRTEAKSAPNAAPLSPAPPPNPPPPANQAPPPAVAALPPPAAPAAPPSLSGKWRIAAAGACSMTGELTINGSAVRAKLVETSSTYELEGTVEDGIVRATSTGQNLYRLEGQFPDGIIGRGSSRYFSAGFCNGVSFILKRVD